MDDKKLAQFQRYSAIIQRAKLAGMMGVSFDGKRNLFEALGYPISVTIADYYMQFKRHDIANAIIDRPIKVTWQGDVTLFESDDDKETAFEAAWKQLSKEHKLKDKFIRIDRLTCLGRYGVLLLGLDDVKSKDDALKPVKPGPRKLLYVKPLMEESAKVSTWDNQPSSPRYGLPVTYDVQISNPNDAGGVISIKVHHTRIIHIVGEKLESEVYGVPVLEKVFNRCKDLEKIIGGSAEMFWKGARPGHQAKVEEGYTLDVDAEEDLEKQLDEYEHQLRRIITMQGVDLKELGAQVSDPIGHVEVQLMMISAATGIPKRILVGSERGELASSQDMEQWKELVQARRDEYAKPKIVDAFVERCIEYKILPTYKETYSVLWSDLFSVSEKEKSEIGKTRATALKEYTQNPASAEVLPEQAFFEYFLGLSPDQIEQIEELKKQVMLDEENDFEEPEIIEPNEEEEE